MLSLCLNGLLCSFFLFFFNLLVCQIVFFFFFQAEDGIRDGRVTGVQTCCSSDLRDAKSYYRDGDAIVFNRPLGIKRNSVVLPPGFELVGCSVPSQVLSEPDGRISISFMNPSAGEAPLILRARPGARTGPSAAPHPSTQSRSWEAPFAGETERQRLSERAHQDRDIVYFLQQ